MGIEAILREVDVLHRVGTTLEGLADEQDQISDGLLRIADSIHKAAILLAVLVATNTD